MPAFCASVLQDLALFACQWIATGSGSCLKGGLGYVSTKSSAHEKPKGEQGGNRVLRVHVPLRVRAGAPARAVGSIPVFVLEGVNLTVTAKPKPRATEASVSLVGG